MELQIPKPNDFLGFSNYFNFVQWITRLIFHGLCAITTTTLESLPDMVPAYIRELSDLFILY